MVSRAATFTKKVLWPALENVGIEPNRDRERSEQKPLYVFEPIAHHGIKVIVRKLSDIGSKLAEVVSIVNEPTKLMKIFGIEEVKISNDNGKLASTLEPSAYNELKASIMQDYHTERVRLIDYTTEWYETRGQEHDHIRLPHVYQAYTEGKGKGKTSKG